jgi:hypothetical protein
MEGPPDEASVPLPASPEASALTRQSPLSLQAVVQYLREGNSQPSRTEDVRPGEGEEDPPAAAPPARRPPSEH